MVALVPESKFRNMFWTFAWIYLIVEAWKYWKWKALLPYPLQVIIQVIISNVLGGGPLPNDPLDLVTMPLPVIVIKSIINIGGLVVFYIFLRKSRKENALDMPVRTDQQAFKEEKGREENHKYYDHQQTTGSGKEEGSVADDAIHDTQEWVGWVIVSIAGMVILSFIIISMIGILNRDREDLEGHKPHVSGSSGSGDRDYTKTDTKVASNDVTNTQWKKFGTDREGDHFYRFDESSKAFPDILSVTTRLVYSEEGKKGYIQKRQEAKLPVQGFDQLNSRTVLYGLNCEGSKKEICVLEIFELTGDGKTLDYAKAGSYKDWNEIPPGTVYDELNRMICTGPEGKSRQDNTISDTLQKSSDGVAGEKVDSTKDRQAAGNENTAEHRFNRGASYPESGTNRREEVDAYRKDEPLESDNAAAHFNRGVTYVESGMYQEAVEAYRQTIRIQPDYAVALNNLGWTYKKLGRYQEAVQVCKQALSIKPDLPEAHFNVGEAYLILNDRRAALHEYSILKNLDKKLAKELLTEIENKTKNK
jgi:hypothetical protein